MGLGMVDYIAVRVPYVFYIVTRYVRFTFPRWVSMSAATVVLPLSYSTQPHSSIESSSHRRPSSRFQCGDPGFFSVARLRGDLTKKKNLARGDCALDIVKGVLEASANTTMARVADVDVVNKD